MMVIMMMMVMMIMVVMMKMIIRTNVLSVIPGVEGERRPSRWKNNR